MAKKSSDKKNDKKKESNKNKKPGFWSKIQDFFKSLGTELKRVIWPDKRTTGQTTLVVIVIVFFVAVLVFLVDTIMVWILGALGFNTATPTVTETPTTTTIESSDLADDAESVLVTTTGELND